MQLILQQAALSLSNMLFPPRCASCGKDIARAHRLCVDCYDLLELLPLQKCLGCGFETFTLINDHCYHCHNDPLEFTSFHAACKYNDFSADLIARLKFSDHLYLVPAIGQLMLQALNTDDFDDYIITAVPMHYKRRWKRRYNQSAELARFIAKKLHKPYIPDLVLRHKATRPQVGQTGASRRRNLKNAFSLNPKSNIKPTSVLLIDDVVTTGSTIREVSKLLKQAGYRIHILVFARTDGILH